VALAVLVLCALLAAPVGASRYPRTRSVSLARARAAIIKTSPRDSKPRIGRCRRSREWTTCDVYERRRLSEAGGASYPVTLEFIECVGARGHMLIFNTREVALIFRSASAAVGEGRA
jgi:hypothetical protein